MEGLLSFNSLVLEELSQLFDLCMEIAGLGTDIVLRQNAEQFEQFTISVNCRQPGGNVTKVLERLKQFRILRVSIKFDEIGVTEEDYENTFVKYTEKGRLYCCRVNITDEIACLKRETPNPFHYDLFLQVLLQNGFGEWKEIDIMTFAAKSKELALAYMIKQYLNLPYVMLSKTGDNYAQIGIPVTDTAVIRVLNDLYNDLKYGIFGESDVADDEMGYSYVLGLHKGSMRGDKDIFGGYGYVFGGSDTDYIITDKKWYFRITNYAEPGHEATMLLRNKLQKQMSEFTGYRVRLSDAVYLADYFAAYQKAVQIFKKISCDYGLLITKVHYWEGMLRTDIYVKDTALEKVRKLLCETQEIISVKSINEFEVDYCAYTECYAGGMIYRIMDTHL